MDNLLYVVTLTENDVPGAAFINPNVQEHSVRELKRWLECRGLNRTGTKKELVERCQNCIAAGRAHLIDVSVDKGKWLDLKREAAANQTSQSVQMYNPGPSTSRSLAAPSSAVGNFQQFPSVNIPEMFNKGHIFHYLIESLGVETETLSTEKPFSRGEQYVTSGFVNEMRDCYIDNRYIVKCNVQSSFRTDVYSVSVELSQRTGFILKASCECKASSLGRCSHVSACLLSIHKHVEEHGNKALACTSKPCQWGKGSLKKTPQRVVEATYPSAIDRSNRGKLDTRATRHQQTEATKKDVNDYLGVLDTENKTQKMMWQELFQYSYEDFVLDDEELAVLKLQCEQFIGNLTDISHRRHQSSYMILGTEEQATSPEWTRWRRVLITSSSAHQALHLQSSIARKNFLKQKLWNMNYFQTEAMTYGSNKEKFARSEYETYALDPDSWVVTTGLWINKQYPVLGCSPDGLVFKEKGSLRGILEIKCPKILEQHHPENFDVVLSQEQKKRFCLLRKDGAIILKKEHAYYTQVQMTMAITESTFCDFVVWSAEGFVVIPISFDQTYWESIFPRLVNIHQNLIVPEYFVHKTPRDLLPIEL